ncbi:PepSY domain-containing protein [Pseudomonas sp. Pseusp122]|jgi:uncharacterized membrane protein YkoI|uniref:PepSY domain-containing protein n=1 Tax=unclassified Pseudomonas TaxID=196821 RepID=UPI0039A6EB17
MQKPRRLYLFCGVILMMLCTRISARDLDQDEALKLRQSGVIQSLEQCIDVALKRYPESRLLEAELELKHDIYVYEIELLTREGIVRELKFDARNSRLIEDKEDD